MFWKLESAKVTFGRATQNFRILRGIWPHSRATIGILFLYGLGQHKLCRKGMFMKFIRSSIVMVLCGLAGLLVAEEKPVRILAMGDSLMAWHNVSGRSIPHAIAKDLK